ncbi:MAG: hypothetical protein HYX78_10795 [Armatimonadetes bacterium]|nr:hypothetical protein [Armatimonadota bacterium]
MTMYLDDNCGSFPALWWKTPVYTTIRGKTPPTLDQRCWRDVVIKYIKSWRLLLCTERYKDHEVGTNITAREAAEAKIGILTVSYAMNQGLSGWYDSANLPHSISEVRSGSKTFMLAESGRVGFSTEFSPWDPDGLTGRPSGWDSLAKGIDFLGYNQMAYELHAGGGNVAFVDGHVKYYKFQNWAKVCYPVFQVTQLGQDAPRSTREYREGWELGGVYLWYPNRAPK